LTKSSPVLICSSERGERGTQSMPFSLIQRTLDSKGTGGEESASLFLPLTICKEKRGGSRYTDAAPALDRKGGGEGKVGINERKCFGLESTQFKKGGKKRSSINPELTGRG